MCAHDRVVGEEEDGDVSTMVVVVVSCIMSPCSNLLPLDEEESEPINNTEGDDDEDENIVSLPFSTTAANA
eukprot:13909777-Ditylum_brightwellii.AAC.1